MACGYNLFGLGDEPRCPECGLLNIPSAFRQQVWDLVDSGRWFFSGFFTPFAKRPPGWWWALDRSGDVRRSFKFAGRNILIAAVLIVTTAGAAGSLLLEATTTYTYPDPDAPSEDSTETTKHTHTVGIAQHDVRRTDNVDYVNYYMAPPTARNQTTSFRVLVEPSLSSFAVGGVLFVWTVWIWGATALVGLWTQIRKGLPKFARAPHTIITACNYESHRLLYQSLIVAGWVIMDALLRAVILPGKYATVMNPGVQIILWAWYSAFGVAGWVGPLRSDYTKQLVRSRWHASRILIMYALVFPWVLTLISMAIVTIALDLILGIDM